MGYVDEAEFNPYAPPKSAPGDYGQAVLAPVEYGGFLARLAALFIDAFILSLINLGLNLAVAFAGVAIGLDRVILSLLSSLLSIIIQVCYNPLMISSEKQATYGKMAMGLKVTDLEGRRIGFGRALGREFAKFLSAIIFLIGYIMAAFTERKQALHDMIAGTLVIKSR